MELFDEAEVSSLSPKAQWMVKHRISTFAPLPDAADDRWQATAPGIVVKGGTEEEALLNLALKLKLTYYK
jgi:hypothetical protein